MNRVRLSEMKPGDRGYLPSEGAVVRLVEHVSDGPTLVFDQWDGDCADDVPTIIVDTDDVQGVDR